MKRLFFKIYILLLVPFFGQGLMHAQSIATEDSILRNFRGKTDIGDKFQFFFGSSNRYNENSAYDWLDVVNLELAEAQKLKDSAAINQYRIMQSQIYYDLGKYDESLAAANDLYKEKEKLGLGIKRILLDLMDFNYARLQLYDKQLEIRKEKKALGLSSNITTYDIYSNLGLPRKAMEDYIMEMKKTIDENNHFGLAQYHNNVGNYLRLDKSTAVALSKFREAKGHIEVFLNDITNVKTEKEIIEGNYLKGIIEGNIGKCYVQLKQFKEAIPWLEQGIATIEEYNKGKYSGEVVENTLELAECYLQLENYAKAKEYLTQDLNLFKVEHTLYRNRLLAAYYDKIQDFRNAAFFLNKNVKIRDSLAIYETALRSQQLKAVMGQDLANNRNLLEEQKLALEWTRSEMQAKDERINLVFISLIFTLLGFAGLVYAYLKSIKTQRLIAEQKYIIEASLVEKDSLLKEIHHRVKNNLQMVSSLLSLQTKNTRSKAAIEALEEGKSRVKAMALIHQKLYQNDDLSVIEMQGYIESLINSIQSVYKKGGHSINITIDAEGTELDIDRAIPFGLILNELVSNSFKYAFPNDSENGKIYIHLRKNGDKGFFEYTDNGVGLPEDTDNRTNASMGIRLMNRLVNQLQSTLNIDKTSEGVRFWFDFK
ncbi:MAG: histidine kinase dimerization/phosphoacceptor domain -containing protein [Sediminicola sp.]